MHPDTIQGILCVAGAAIIHLTFGYFYTIGNMIPYIMSYLKERGGEVYFSASALGIQGVSMPLGALFNKHFGFRMTAIVSCLLDSAGVILTYWTINIGFISVVLTYSILLGIGFGFGYSVVIQLAVRWFPHRRGLVIGIVVGGFGAGGILFTPIQLAYVNPGNVHVNETTKLFDNKELLARIPYLFLICGSVLLCLQMIGCFLLRRREVDRESSDILDKPLTMKQILKRGDFYIVWLIMICHTIPVTIMTSLFKAFGNTLINDDFFLTAVATMSSFFNLAGRLCWGMIVDKLSFKLSLYMMLVLWFTAQVTFPFLSLLKPDGAPVRALYTIWVAVLFFTLSGTFVLMPTTTSKIFGPINMSIAYSLVYSAFSVGCLTGAALVSAMGNRWFVIFFFGGSVNLVAFVLVTLLPDNEMNKRLNICKSLTDRVWGTAEEQEIERDENKTKISPQSEP